MTSLTTIIVILLVFLFGGETIRGFAFALTTGIILGTYSSLCIGSPLSAQLIEWGNKKAAQKNGDK
jgi:SecD/SecF fusion protein